MVTKETKRVAAAAPYKMKDVGYVKAHAFERQSQVESIGFRLPQKIFLIRLWVKLEKSSGISIIAGAASYSQLEEGRECWCFIGGETIPKS